MTIEIDDAGGGCPILGEMFLIRRVETDEYIPRYISREERSTKSAAQILFDELISFGVEPNEKIHLCRGQVFDALHQKLKMAHYYVNRVEITGKTNDVAEELFHEKLYEIGFPREFVLKDKDYGSFYNIVMTWYNTFYEGESLLKRKMKDTTRDYIINSVYKHPNLMSHLYYVDFEQRK